MFNSSFYSFSSRISVFSSRVDALFIRFERQRKTHCLVSATLRAEISHVPMKNERNHEAKKRADMKNLCSQDIFLHILFEVLFNETYI